MKFDNWAEILGFIVLVIGFFAAVGAGSAVVSYLIILLAGMMAGRVWYRIRANLKVAWSLVLIAFLIGFVLGSYYGDRRVIIVLYVLGIAVSYYVHLKGYIKSVEW